MIVQPCAFEDILPTWSSMLWPGRTSAIEPTSAMKWLGGIDMDIMSAKPTFWRVVEKVPEPLDINRSAKVLGVLSGHFGGLTSHSTSSDAERSYRTRGLWVHESVRRKGAAKLLMEAAFAQAHDESCPLLWTFPRLTSMPFYEAMGFRREGPWIGVNDPGAGEFGPNCYAIAKPTRLK